MQSSSRVVPSALLTFLMLFSFISVAQASPPTPTPSRPAATAHPAGVPHGIFCGLRNDGCGYGFESGIEMAYVSAGTPAALVRGRILDLYAAHRWETGWMGYPVLSESCGLVGGGCWSQFEFENSAIYWSPATDARFIRGLIRDKWNSINYEWGKFGYPVTDEFCGLRNGGCGQHFQRENGSIYWSSSSGAHTVQGLIKDRWAQFGWEAGDLGYPMTDEFGVEGGVQQNFQGGFLAWQGGEVYGGYWDNPAVAAVGRPTGDQLAAAHARRGVTTPTPSTTESRVATPRSGLEWYAKQCLLFGTDHILHNNMLFPAENRTANLKCGVRGTDGTGGGWGWRHIKRRHSKGDSNEPYDNNASKWEDSVGIYLGFWDLRMTFASMIVLNEAKRGDVATEGGKLVARKRIPLISGGDLPVRVVVGTTDNTIITSFPEI